MAIKWHSTHQFVFLFSSLHTQCVQHLLYLSWWQHLPLYFVSLSLSLAPHVRVICECTLLHSLTASLYNQRDKCTCSSASVSQWLAVSFFFFLFFPSRWLTQLLAASFILFLRFYLREPTDSSSSSFLLLLLLSPNHSSLSLSLTRRLNVQLVDSFAHPPALFNRNLVWNVCKVCEERTSCTWKQTLDAIERKNEKETKMLIPEGRRAEWRLNPIDSPSFFTSFSSPCACFVQQLPLNLIEATVSLPSSSTNTCLLETNALCKRFHYKMNPPANYPLALVFSNSFFHSCTLFISYFTAGEFTLSSGPDDKHSRQMHWLCKFCFNPSRATSQLLV